MYTKIDELMWKDKDFKRKVSTTYKLMIVYLITSHQRNQLGLYNLQL
jgi:hypothetical protein